MPSVGMRRTRVFGVVKGADGARVLRSGRRLSSDFGHWYQQSLVKKNSGNGLGGLKCKPNGWTHVEKINFKHVEEREGEETDSTEIIKNEKETKVCKKVKEEEEVKEVKVMDKMFGIVYRRKRKRLGGESSELSSDKMYGIRFQRRTRRKNLEDSGVDSESMEGFVRDDEELGGLRVFGIGLDSSCIGWSNWFACFVILVLRYMEKARLELHELASFLLSQPINEVLSLHGIRFLWDPPIGVAGMFKLFEAMQVMPLFSVDFSAVPSCFMYIHCSMLVRLKRLPPVLVNNLVYLDSNNEIMSSIRSYQSYESSDDDVEYVWETKTMVPVVDSAVKWVTLHPSVRASKLSGRNGQYRNALNSRTIQKRRSSLRRRRARNPSLGGAHKGSGTLVSDLVSRRNVISFSSVVSKNKLRSSIRSSPTSRFKEFNSEKDETRQDLVPNCCSASILVIDSDRCYRVEGASVMLEMSASREWLLVVKKDGVTRYNHRAQKIMRPCSSNRVTHDIVWSGDDNWKLEFPNRQDWLIFKDLYKECSDRNVHAPVAKVIPVPGVRVVSGYEESITVPFRRPDSYISVSNGEVSRALTKRTANYDMDSEDEEWLKKFNNEFCMENELNNHVSEDNFELMVDAFEKAYFCSPDEYSNEGAAVSLCLHLARREVVQAVYIYWVKKRKQKHIGLLRVFQQVKKPSLIPKPALRKRRSFKRQVSQLGRGKQSVLMQAILVKQDAIEEQNAIFRVEEAKASAKQSVESAVSKRQRAQLLMEIADLATYKAAIALKIAEAAEVAESAEAAAVQFLDGEA